MSSLARAWCVVGLLAASWPAHTQPSIDAPDAPTREAMVTRDDRGGATVRAVRLTTPLRLDGRLDEDIYALVPAVGGFIQQLPRPG